MASTLGQINPLRYRGYVYDSETGLYYLQSRYYNPEWGRFINGDDRLLLEQSAGYNLFAYCNNNPVNMIDPSGHVGYSIYDYYYGKGFYCVKDYGEWAVFANRKTGATETWGKKESKDKSKGGGVYGAQWGVSGGLAIFGSAQLMYVRDGEGNEAVAYVFGVGGGVGASAGGSIVIFPEEGMTVFDLEGQGVAAGISAAVVSVDYQGSGGYNGVSGGGGVPIAPIGKIGLGLYGSTTFTTIFAYRKAGGEWQWK